MITKGNWDKPMGCNEDFKPKTRMRMAIIAKRDPLKGFPDNQAKAATVNNGRQMRVPNSLLDGSHWATSAIKNK